MAEITPNGPGLVAPTYFPPRDVRSSAQDMNGNIDNPPAFCQMGGLTGPSKMQNTAQPVTRPMPGKASVTRKASKV